jgi:hypothetical protein
MSKLNKRGRVVLIYTPLTIALVCAIVWVSARVWYVPEEGYCIGTMVECFTR